MVCIHPVMIIDRENLVYSVERRFSQEPNLTGRLTPGRLFGQVGQYTIYSGAFFLFFAADLAGSAGRTDLIWGFFSFTIKDLVILGDEFASDQ